MSTVTYSAVDGIAMIGLNKRSNRVGLPVPPTPSFALMWKAALFGEPTARKAVLLVVHGTVLAPPPCDTAHPAGKEPEATPSKFSEKSVVETGLPVGCK